ncbi:MarR family winged helix-turn-helix transcriptional regulator [Paenibacillus sp. 2TAB19]|uniref:MarR family winged helix-turn-helix transcriptional regulator n=1 Tax=Paenibacillus sp. 2TAB19 TaxID=3233003 RepID=UPI003F964A52
MNIDDTIKLDNQICFSIYACSREITKLYRPILDELGLTYTQYVTMLALWEQDHISVSALGHRLYLDSGTLTPLLKKLEAAGLLTRTRDREDERSVLVTLTEQGQALKNKAYEVPPQLYCQLDSSPEEAHSLLQQMNDLLGKIQQITGKS